MAMVKEAAGAARRSAEELNPPWGDTRTEPAKKSPVRGGRDSTGHPERMPSDHGHEDAAKLAHALWIAVRWNAASKKWRRGASKTLKSVLIL